ncbi:Structural maintenance of chromosomes protein 5 [Elasticomyces elasticus]|nr:Structural maintenance of chromosomes protein 5 [Elasticomyces elasticus]
MAEKSENQASNIKTAIEAKKQQIKELDGENAATKKLSDKARQNMPGLQWNKTALERVIENKPADIDFPAYNERLREVTRQIKDIHPRREEIRLGIGSLSQNIQQRAAIIEQAEAEKASLNTVSCSARDPRFARQVESALGEGEMIAFTATSRDDYRELGKVVHDELRLDRINIRQSGTPLANFRAPCTDEQLRSHGLKGWILDLIEGPEVVLAMLCDNRRIQATGYTTRDRLGNAAVAALKGPQSPITSWVTGTESFQVSRRHEYGEHATSMRVNQLGQARYFTDVSAAQHEDEDMEARVEAAQRAIEEYQQTKAELSREFKAKAESRERLVQEDADIREEKNTKQKALSQYNALPTKSESAEDKLTEAREKINALGATRREIAGRGDRLTVEKG